jgi:3-hydroxyisobutyrate dehydrogenase-like beta-hydroxyacid dehydrogenase
MSVTVGFIGFGEVGCTLSAAMRACGVEVAAYDIVEKKVTLSGVPYRPLGDLAGRADYLLSAVTTQAAVGVAESCVRYLESGQVYVDLNSTSPAVKAELDKIIRPSGAHFVEGAILGAVGVTGADTRILVGGPQARAVAEALTGAGLRASFYSEEIGKASMFKMLRSIFSKGLEALILELLIAGKRAGIGNDLWLELVELMTKNPFERVAENWVQSHPVAYDRRYHEMVQVTATIREIGLSPLMTTATETFFDRSRALGLDEAFPAKPACMEDVVAFMEDRLCGPERRVTAGRPTRPRGDKDG